MGLPRRPKPTTLEEWEDELRRVGIERKAASDAHDAAVQQLADAVSAAKAAGIPTRIITAQTGVSKQWISKLYSYRGRQR